MKKIFPLALLLLLTREADAFYLSGGLPIGNTETITANLASTSFTIPSNFVGFSEENGDIVVGGTPYTGRLFASTNTSLLNLIKLLGSNGLIRIGANSGQTPNDSMSTPPALTQPIATEIAAFASNLGSGWTVVYELDGKAVNSSLAVTHAGYMETAFSGVSNPLILGFMNEPDLFGISEGQIQTNWNSYYSAVNAAQPLAVYEGLEMFTSTESTVASYIAGITNGLGGLNFASSHYYPEGLNTTSSIATVISEGSSSNFSSFTAYASGKYRLDETNISAGQATSTATQSLTAAAWYLNVAMNLASEGGIGISNHNVVSAAGWLPSSFTAAWNQNAWLLQGDGGWAPGAIFYGMYLMSKIEGQQIIATTANGNGNVNIISTKNGVKANILVVNNDTVNGVNIIPNQSTAWNTASALVLDGGSSGCSNLTPTIGGQSIGEGGTWSGSSYSINNGGYVHLNPCGSALIQVTS